MTYDRGQSDTNYGCVSCFLHIAEEQLEHNKVLFDIISNTTDGGGTFCNLLTSIINQVSLSAVEINLY